MSFFNALNHPVLMQFDLSKTRREVSLLSLIVTLAIIHWIEPSWLVLILLLCFWGVIFFPWRRVDVLLFSVASLFFLFQNYAVLKVGGFSFKHQDILLMPYYEPFLWGFYFVNIKRFFAEPIKTSSLSRKSFIGLFTTMVAFSLFSKQSETLLIVSSVSTIFLLVLFHQRRDLYYGAYALLLGFVIELFGVSTGLWRYPHPDFLGVPYWFAPMWISVGILARRFVIPLAEWLDAGIRKRIT